MVLTLGLGLDGILEAFSQGSVLDDNSPMPVRTFAWSVDFQDAILTIGVS